MQITELFKYSLPNMLNAYNANKHLITAHLSGKSIEGKDSSSNTILGLAITVFLILLLINLALFIVALVLLIKNWHNLPAWCQAAGLIFLILPPPGPLITIILVLIVKNQ